MSERIGFIGLGIMGQGMVNNLIKAGHAVSIWNRTRSRMERFIEAGANPCTSPADVAAHSEIVITCVSDTVDVEEVILRENGAIYGIESGNLVIDMSTISPQMTRYIAGALAQKGAHMLDAPISGGSEGAANGTLSIMVGGSAFRLNALCHILKRWAKQSRMSARLALDKRSNWLTKFWWL